MDFGRRRNCKLYFPVDFDSTHTATRSCKVRDGNHFIGCIWSVQVGRVKFMWAIRFGGVRSTIDEWGASSDGVKVCDHWLEFRYMVEKRRHFFSGEDLNLFWKLWLAVFWDLVCQKWIGKIYEWILGKGKAVNGISPIRSDYTHIETRIKEEREENNFSGEFGVCKLVVRNMCKAFNLGDQGRRLTVESLFRSQDVLWSLDLVWSTV